MKIITMHKKQRGLSMIETVMYFPVLMLIGLGIVHLGLVYQAKANLEYAALMAARIGAVNSINMSAMQGELVRRMAPVKVGASLPSSDQFVIQVLNPTLAMFDACGVRPQITDDCVGDLESCEIPNFGLQYRPVGTECDGASIQDANILRIKVTYRFNSKIPFMNIRIFASDDGNLKNEGTDISAIATVRMQSPARRTSAFD